MLNYFFCEECEQYHFPNRLINGQVLIACECELKKPAQNPIIHPHSLQSANHLNTKINFVYNEKKSAEMTILGTSNQEGEKSGEKVGTDMGENKLSKKKAVLLGGQKKKRVRENKQKYEIGEKNKDDLQNKDEVKRFSSQRYDSVLHNFEEKRKDEIMCDYKCFYF